MQCLFRTTIREKLAQQRNHTINRPIVLISRWSPKSREEGERTERESAVEEMETLMKTRRWRHTTPRVSTYLYDPVDISSSRHVASARLWLAGSFGALSYRRLCKKKSEKKVFLYLYYSFMCCCCCVWEKKFTSSIKNTAVNGYGGHVSLGRSENPLCGFPSLSLFLSRWDVVSFRSYRPKRILFGWEHHVHQL